MRTPGSSRGGVQCSAHFRSPGEVGVEQFSCLILTCSKGILIINLSWWWGEQKAKMELKEYVLLFFCKHLIPSQSSK